MISWENYEEYIIMYADGELPAADEQELMAFLTAHPELKKELSVYELTRLAPDETIVYPDKKALLKQSHAKRIILFPTWAKYGVAAGIAAMLFISSYKYWSTGNINTVVKNDTAKHISPVERGSVPAVNPPVQNTPAPTQNVATVAQPPAHHKQPAPISNKAVNKKQEVIAVVDKNTRVTRPQDEIKTMAVATAKPLPCDNADVSLAQFDTPDLPLPTEQQEAKRSFWNWLPMEEDKKNRIENIAGVIAGAFTETGDAKAEATDRKIDIKVEKRKLKLTF